MDASDFYSNLSREDFSEMGLPIPSSTPTPEEVTLEARERSTDLLFKWVILKDILERHELTLRKRWVKKTKKARTNIVTNAWPNIATMHRPDFEALRREGPKILSEGSRREYRDWYMWPYINVEDLVRGKTLLLMLNSRGRNPPRMFAHADFEAMRIGHISQAVFPPFLNCYTMYLLGESVDTYGRLVSWDDDDEAFNAMMTQIAHQPGEGLMILEIQQRILGFLVDCCREILHDFDSNTLLAAPIKPDPPSLADGAEYSLISSVAAEAPYRLSARVDFRRLGLIAAARRSSAEDHIYSMREDPGYFAGFLKEWGEHRQEQLLDTKGRQHPVLGQSVFWDRVIGNVITDAYWSLVVWDQMAKVLNELALLQVKYCEDIKPGEKLPVEYLKALVLLEQLLDFAKNHPIHVLQHGLVASPPMRSQFVRQPHVPGSTMIGIQSKSALNPLVWLFFQLWDERQLFLLGLPKIVDEIEYIAQSDAAGMSPMSPWVSRVFSDLGLIGRIRHELDIYQPWAAVLEEEGLPYKDEVMTDLTRRISPTQQIIPAIEGATFGTLGGPVAGRFSYPSDKRRTKENVTQMRKAEINLDIFWNAVDTYVQRRIGQSPQQIVGNLFEHTHHLERTSEWIEPIQLENTAKAIQPLQDSFSNLSLQPSNPETTFTPSASKAKTKTRGTRNKPSVDASRTEQEDLLDTNSAAKPLFRVKNRVFKVFKTLFFNPSQTNTPGEVSWVDFLFAMSAIGFTPEKLYGSIWQFTPASLGAERSIQFHEPHPIGKIPFRSARRIGRRLNRAYGWDGSMFVLE